MAILRPSLSFSTNFYSKCINFSFLFDIILSKNLFNMLKLAPKGPKYWSKNSILWSQLHPQSLCLLLELQTFRYGERFVDEDLEEMMKDADLDRLASGLINIAILAGLLDLPNFTFFHIFFIRGLP